MEYSFNFYDFASYIIPGGLTLISLFWAVYDIFGFNIFPHIESLSSAIIILIASYGLGFLILPIGSWIDHRNTEKRGGHFSYLFIKPDDTHYSSEFKSNLKLTAEQKFGISWESGNQEENKKRAAEIFYLCYYYATNKVNNQYIDIFNGIFGLFRNLLGVGIITGFISCIIIIKDLIYLSLPCYFQFCLFHSMMMAFCGLFTSVLIFFAAYSQLDRFSKHFADSIYRNFYVLIQDDSYINSKEYQD